MNIPPLISRLRQSDGWALLVVMTLTGAAMLTLAGVMNWANQNATATARTDELFATSYAAESATEKAIGGMALDYEDGGAALVASKTSTYATNIPTAGDSPTAYWTNYIFGSGTATSNSLIVSNTGTVVTIWPTAPYAGLYASATIYEVIANAQNTHTEFKITATVGQKLNLGLIPIFQFAIFYQNDMEICPSPNMTVSGPVHCNANIYMDPASQLVFSNTVTATSNIFQMTPDSLDPTHSGSSGGTITFHGTPSFTTNVAPLNLPVGTNANSDTNVNAILQIPPVGEPTTNSPGTNRLFNLADMIILVSNTSVTVTSGVGINGQATAIPSNEWSQFLTINNASNFYNVRESQWINPVTINVTNLVAWSGTNNNLNPALQSARGSSDGNVSSIYIADERTMSNGVAVTVVTNTPGTNLPAAGTYSSIVTTNKNGQGKVTSYTYNAYTGVTNGPWTNIAEPGIVLTNGAILPNLGLSIGTPDPLYVVGNWNVQTNRGGSSDVGLNTTAYTYPSALFADSVQILSPAWNPNNSANANLSGRAATSDTVNAAILTGIVPSDTSNYSGGVENFPRFMEDWSGSSVTFTYNGSMVAMFTSCIAKAPFLQTGGTYNVYNPPIRAWAFDKNFSNPAKLPPLTPSVTYISRGQWSLLAPHTTSF